MRITAESTATVQQAAAIARMRKEIDATTGNRLTFRKLDGGFIAVTEYDRKDRTKSTVQLYPSGVATDVVTSSY
jgi:hypothetical protein